MLTRKHKPVVATLNGSNVPGLDVLTYNVCRSRNKVSTLKWAGVHRRGQFATWYLPRKAANKRRGQRGEPRPSGVSASHPRRRAEGTFGAACRGPNATWPVDLDSASLAVSALAPSCRRISDGAAAFATEQCRRAGRGLTRIWPGGCRRCTGHRTRSRVYRRQSHFADRGEGWVLLNQGFNKISGMLS